jgi:cellulose synthase (UDP-forming)
MVTTTQSGIERGTCPVPAAHPGSRRGEIRLSRAVLWFTAVAAGLLSVDLGRSLADSRGAGDLTASVVFGVVVLFLVYGNLVYQVCRLGSLHRHHAFDHLDDTVLRGWVRTNAAPLTVLVPSYREELRTVEQTLLSAALQQYPGMEIVLCLDDPPAPADQAAAAATEATRALVARLQHQLDLVAAPIEESLARLRVSRANSVGEPGGDAEAWDEAARRLDLARLEAIRWIEAEALRWRDGDHTDRFFAENVLASIGRLVAVSPAERRDWGRLEAEHLDLLAVFRVQLSVFERKRYENLSHEPNKAMNLNSYLSLLGGRWREELSTDGIHLVPAGGGPACLEAADPTYVLTLDADSLLLPGYAARLVHQCEQPRNQRVAVIQTPYRAVPGTTSELERIAGATTDMQHIIHQGLARHDATFWVGANALLRKRALDDIAEVDHERGHRVVRYIQDRTVIEDTESSIDLVARGWTLENYPASLAYSATPPDFGALLIQRRRWANGGLIVLPKLLRLIARRSCPGGMIGAALRVHYLISIAGTNIALLLLLCYGFPGVTVSPWLPLSAVGYFALYLRDLVQLGYRATDVVGVYALNLLLLPVNLAGVTTSLHQAATGAKIPFGRTPKVEDRTSVQKIYLRVPLALIGVWTATSAFAISTGRIANAAFVAGNVALLVYALVRFVGASALSQDLRHRARPATPRTPIPARVRRLARPAG